MSGLWWCLLYRVCYRFMSGGAYLSVRSAPRTSYRRRIILRIVPERTEPGLDSAWYISFVTSGTRRLCASSAWIVLIWRKSSVATEAETRFLVYGAELVEAVDFIHSVLKIMHRGLKPALVAADLPRNSCRPAPHLLPTVSAIPADLSRNSANPVRVTVLKTESRPSQHEHE